MSGIEWLVWVYHSENVNSVLSSAFWIDSNTEKVTGCSPHIQIQSNQWQTNVCRSSNVLISRLIVMKRALPSTYFTHLQEHLASRARSDCTASPNTPDSLRSRRKKHPKAAIRYWLVNYNHRNNTVTKILAVLLEETKLIKEYKPSIKIHCIFLIHSRCFNNNH